MKKYIESEQIIEQLTKMKDNFSPTVRPMFDVFKHIVLETSAADVESVRHGEWIEYSNDPNIITCSECDWGEPPVSKKYKRCPMCGAKMDGGTKK